MTWFSGADLTALLPIIALALGALGVLIVGAAARSEEARAALPYLAVGSILIAAVGVGMTWGDTATLGGGAMRLGPFAGFIALTVLGAGAVCVLYSSGYASALGFEVGEYYGLLLFALAGIVYIACTNDLITAFIAFELMSLSVYALCAIHRGSESGYEGALKYFVMGAFASGFLVFGMALLYGAAGTVHLDQMRWVASRGDAGLALVAVGLMMVGFAFKVGAVPFHSWVPDAYQSAPASVTGFMAVAVKAGAFAILIRVLAGTGFLMPEQPLPFESLTGVVWVLAFVTMVVGNLIALAQDNLKRLMAYSGIAHTGYLLVGVAAGTRVTGSEEALAGVLFYLAGYAATTLGVFAVLVSLRRGGRDIERVQDLSGLAQERPGAALCLTICLLSLVGMPPTAGFVGKLWLFRGAIEAGLIGLVIVACLTTAISIYYYLRPVVLMYTAAPIEPVEHAPPTFGGRAALILATAATLLLGILPARAFSLATEGVRALLP